MPLTLYRLYCNLLQGATSSGKVGGNVCVWLHYRLASGRSVEKVDSLKLGLRLYLGHSPLIKCHQCLLPP